MAFWNLREPKTRPLSEVVVPRTALAQLTSEEHKQLVVLRAAMRALPGVQSIGDGPWRLGAEVELPIRLHATRTAFVAFATHAFGGVREGALEEALSSLRRPLARLDDGMPQYYQQNIISSDYGVNASEQNTLAARRAVALVEAIGTREFAPLPFETAHHPGDFLETVAMFGPRGVWNRKNWSKVQAEAIGADCAVLADGEPPAALALAPLWPSAFGAALETTIFNGASQQNARELGGKIDLWMRERKDGALVLGRPPSEAREIVVSLANLPAEFWDRDDPVDALAAFDYSLLGYLDNPSWGSATYLCDAFAREYRAQMT